MNYEVALDDLLNSQRDDIYKTIRFIKKELQKVEILINDWKLRGIKSYQQAIREYKYRNNIQYNIDVKINKYSFIVYPNVLQNKIYLVQMLDESFDEGHIFNLLQQKERLNSSLNREYNNLSKNTIRYNFLSNPDGKYTINRLNNKKFREVLISQIQLENKHIEKVCIRKNTKTSFSFTFAEFGFKAQYTIKFYLTKENHIRYKNIGAGNKLTKEICKMCDNITINMIILEQLTC